MQRIGNAVTESYRSLCSVWLIAHQAQHSDFTESYRALRRFFLVCSLHSLPLVLVSVCVFPAPIPELREPAQFVSGHLFQYRSESTNHSDGIA